MKIEIKPKIVIRFLVIFWTCTFTIWFLFKTFLRFMIQRYESTINILTVRNNICNLYDVAFRLINMNEKEIEELKARLDTLEKSIIQIKEALDNAFEGEQAKWQQVFEAVDMNFKEIRDYANDTFLHADTFWEMQDKDKLN